MLSDPFSLCLLLHRWAAWWTASSTSARGAAGTRSCPRCCHRNGRRLQSQSKGNDTRESHVIYFVIWMPLYLSVWMRYGGQVMEIRERKGGGWTFGAIKQNEWHFKRRGRVNDEKHAPQLPLVLKVITAVTKVQYMHRLNANISCVQV